MSDTTLTEAPVEVVPFDESMSKADMQQHIEDVHGVPLSRVFYYRKDQTKARMQEWHEAQHKALDAINELLTAAGHTYEEWQAGILPYRVQDQIQQTAREAGVHSLWNPKVPHVHTPVPVSEAVEAAHRALTTAKDNTPIASLNAAERKALKDVVDNDFNMLKSEMRAMGADMETQARREVEAEWSARQEAARKYVAKAQALLDKHDKACRDLVEKARAEGVTLSMPTTRDRYGLKATAEGYDTAIQRAVEDVKRNLSRAEMTLERQRLTAQRQVLLTGVSGEVARTVLDAIPDAKTLMVQAAQESASKQIDA